ncbi:hypothetical protein LZ518_02105 [Sphingomonas sp. RB56-2]|uniref:Uncharacterized protein n=1 Tax=Sphingomonas brevis TaxID=2908206 RepID=A0ABT0S6B1_9SPHN|nr:hypothetical protein [Sphingomonas brevis]MCL6739931.1 hypothetical protein [Sphingomonas brevis]
MTGRPFTLIAAIVFALIALVHAYRIMTEFQVVIGTHVIAQGVSWVALVITGALSIGLFREALR